MVKKILLILSLLLLLTSSSVYAVKYSINSSGTVKSGGKVVSTPNIQQTTQANYNVYTAPNYVSSNQVNNNTSINYIEIVMDYSGSMTFWINEAKRTMASIIAQIPPAMNVGFRVFGYNHNGNNPVNANIMGVVNKITKVDGKYKVQTTKSPVGDIDGYCSATTQVTKIIPANSIALLSGMNSVDIGGSTPMVYGLDRAINEDMAYISRSQDKKIILITDGGENCGGDPCAYARQLIKTRQDIHVDVVLVTNAYDSGLQCLANVTGGKIYRINNVSQLLPTLTQSMNTAPSEVSEQYYEYYEE